MRLSSFQGIFKRKPHINELVLLAKAGNEEVMSDLLFASYSFLKKTSSFVCKRPIDEHDEEFSIALNGFHEAILAFNQTEAASFHTFAKLIIKRRLIDFIRKEKARTEKWLLFETNLGDCFEEPPILEEVAIHTYNEKLHGASIKDELLIYKKKLEEFNLTFEELYKYTPKHHDARKTIFQIAQIVAGTENLYLYLLQHKKLPIKQMETLVKVSRKTIERNRKYIIAIVLLLNSDLLFIKDFSKC